MSAHRWTLGVRLGGDGVPALGARGVLSAWCLACGRPLVPLKVPDDWRLRWREWAVAEDCAGEQEPGGSTQPQPSND